MSMTLEIPDHIYEQAEAQAAERGESAEAVLLGLLEGSLKEELALEARIEGLPASVVAEIRGLERKGAKRLKNGSNNNEQVEHFYKLEQAIHQEVWRTSPYMPQERES